MPFLVACYPRGCRPTAPPFAGSLDDWSPLLTGVWSVAWRRLTSWTGPLIRLRRVIDSVESDFGPTSQGRLDVEAVATFLGVGVGAITTVYDQYGPHDWTQASAVMQPEFVASLSQFNNAPAMHFPDTAGMTCGSGTALPYSFLLVECNPNKGTVFTDGYRTLDSANSGKNRYISSSRVSPGQAYDGGDIAPALYTADPVVEILVGPGSGNFVFYSNGTNVTTGSIAANDWGGLRLGKSGFQSEVCRSNIIDLVNFHSALDQTQATALQAIFNPATL